MHRRSWVAIFPLKVFFNFFPQQRELMGSSAQNSSGVHWCRRGVRFNEVPENVPKVPEKVWEVLVQSQVMFNRVPEKVPEGLGGFGAEPGQVQQGSGEGSGEGSRKPWFRRRFRRRSGRLRCRSRFRRRFGRLCCRARSGSTKVPEVPEKVPGGFGAEPGEVQQGSEEGSGEGLGGFGAARSGSTGFRRRCRRRFRRRFQEALVQSQVRFNRVPEKVPEKAWEALVRAR